MSSHSHYLDQMGTSTTPLDVMLDQLKQDAIGRFTAGDKISAKLLFRDGVVDAIKVAHKDTILTAALNGMFGGIHLVSLASFAADLDQLIGHVLEQSKIG